MSSENKKPQEKGELQVIEFGGKIVSVYRKCSCGAGEGSVHFTRKEDGTNVANCENCGATLEWGGPKDKS